MLKFRLQNKEIKKGKQVFNEFFSQYIFQFCHCTQQILKISSLGIGVFGKKIIKEKAMS